MLAPKKIITVNLNLRLIRFQRKNKQPKVYQATPQSMNRLFRAVNKEVNKLYAPRIEVMFGGFQVKW